MIWETLHAFAAGISFSAGVVTGALLCQLANRDGKNEIRENFLRHQAEVEDRLMQSMHAHLRIAEALEQNRGEGS